MLMKILLITVVANIWFKTENALLSASIWGITVLLVSLMIEGPTLVILFGSIISFLICLGIFKLMERFDGTGYYWPTAIFGLIVLVFVL
ncbi:MAG: hypothetical protein OEX12_03695 [Gammaproteobacteria bacterium]|nr:hypothetical protein [Gammaproteobacteria bacterium]